MDSEKNCKDLKQDDKLREDSSNDRKSKKARYRSRSPQEGRRKDSRRKRRHSRSKSPNVPSKQNKQTESSSTATDVKAEVPIRKNRDTDMLNTRTGGAYIPPARLRMMQAQITDKSSVPYQRLAWEALKKSIHGHINKINVGNIGIIIKELLKENIVRGRGLLCRSVIQAQAASPTFTHVYAALVAAVNSRFPNIGELLLKRLVIQFKKGFKRNDKPICISSASFIAHLVNQRVAHEILALELLTLLVESPTDDSVEVAIAFLKECGQKLTEVTSKGVNAIFEMLRNILHEGQLDKRVQYMIEVMFQVWKDGFKDHPALIEELELVPEEEQFTHLLMLDDATDPQDILNVFKFDEKYEDNEEKYKTLSKEILGSDAESEDDDGSDPSGSDESDDEEEGDEPEKKEGGVTIIDNTETNLVALRRTIYLTINSSLDFEECAHKLLKMQLKPGQEVELCHMFLDCCAEQRTYEKFYGLLAQRFCNINRMYIGPFEEIFKDSYSTAHRLDTNRLRNVSKFFAHLLFTDSISWEVLECVKLNEEDTTSSSRIYIKILFQELAEYMGLKKLNDRLKDPTLQDAFSGIFPRDNPKNTRFSINFFTSIGLGGLTDELREHLKQMPKNVPPSITEIKVDSGSSSDSSSSSSDSSSSSSSSDSEEESGGVISKEKSKTNCKDKETTKVAEKEPERWGHDGFYETFGRDARRTESRPERRETEKDGHNFARPRDPPKRSNDNRESNRERDYGLRNDVQRNREDENRYDREDERRYGREDYGRSKRNETDTRLDTNDRHKRRQKEQDDHRRDNYSREYKSSRKDRDAYRGDDKSKNDNSDRNKDRYESKDYNNYEKEKRRKDKKHGDRQNISESFDEGYESRKEKDKDTDSERKKSQPEYSESHKSESKKDKKREKIRKNTDSSDDENERRKEKKSSKKDKKTDDDGWDIRGSSVQKELPETRYWDTIKEKKKSREDTEKSTKSSKNKK